MSRNFDLLDSSRPTTLDALRDLCETQRTEMAALRQERDRLHEALQRLVAAQDARHHIAAISGISLTQGDYDRVFAELDTAFTAARAALGQPEVQP